MFCSNGSTTIGPDVFADPPARRPLDYRRASLAPRPIARVGKGWSRPRLCGGWWVAPRPGPCRRSDKKFEAALADRTTKAAVRAQSDPPHQVARSTRVRLNAATLPRFPPTPSCHRERLPTEQTEDNQRRVVDISRPWTFGLHPVPSENAADQERTAVEGGFPRRRVSLNIRAGWMRPQQTPCSNVIDLCLATSRQ
jgi:hypothetical protein